jgi:hypothetical protein
MLMKKNADLHGAVMQVSPDNFIDEVKGKTLTSQGIFIMDPHSEEFPRSNHGSCRFESTPQNEIVKGCIDQCVALQQVLEGNAKNEIRLSEGYLEAEEMNTVEFNIVHPEVPLVEKSESPESTDVISFMNLADDRQSEIRDILAHTKPIMVSAERTELTDPLIDAHLDQIEPNEVTDIEEIHGRSTQDAEPVQVITTSPIIEVDLDLDASKSVESYTNSLKDNHPSDEPTNVHPYPACAEPTETTAPSSMGANLSIPQALDNTTPEASNFSVEADDSSNKSMDVPTETTSIPDQHGHVNGNIYIMARFNHTVCIYLVTTFGKEICEGSDTMIELESSIYCAKSEALK